MSLRGFLSRMLMGRDSAEDWQQGDLAVCFSSQQWSDLNTGRERNGPKADDVLRVSGIAVRWNRQFLKFESWPSDWFAAYCFRKIRPNHREACRPAFARRMKRLRPTVDA